MTGVTTERPIEPVIAQLKPYKLELEAGKEYYICECGESKKMPFCDGSHRAEMKFRPKKIVVDETKDYYLCGCKHTQNEQGFCDGSHRKEEVIRKYNEFLLKSNSKLKTEKKQLEEQLNLAERKSKLANTVAVLSAVILAVSIGSRYLNLSNQ